MKDSLTAEGTDTILGQLSPGVAVIVAKLRSMGYETTDSGDGSNYEDGMECALPYRHVFGVVPDTEDMRDFADRLERDVGSLSHGARIEVSYSPGEPAVFAVFPDGYGSDDSR